MPVQRDPNILAGAEHFEDAGVYRVSENLAIVQTVDFFPPLVDDAWQFGRIAAANSLSDVYAMGGTPITALNIVGFPDKELPAELLETILAGGASTVAEAGAVILGGHSVRDTEIKYGLAVTGTIHPDRIVANNTARPGDVLVLTKPIGSGVLTSAAKSGSLPESEIAEAIEVMAALNRPGGEAMITVGVSAATDVTGFGLIGHAFEMADGSGVTMEIEAAAVPLMRRTYEMAAQGILTRTHKACRHFLGNRLAFGKTDEVLVNILADAQTSGGLLISVPPARLDRLIDELIARRAICAAVVGRVLERGARAIIVA